METKSSIQEYDKALKMIESDSLKSKLELLFKQYQENKKQRESVYTQSIYELDHEYNLKLNDINRKVSDILCSGSGISQYWLKAIVNSKILSVNTRDMEVLKHLINVEVSFSRTNIKDLTIKFTFKPNDYLENDTLEKTYYFNKEKGVYTKVVFTQPKWKRTNVKKGMKPSEGNSFFDIFDNWKIEGYEEEYDYEVDILINDLIPYSVEYYLNIRNEMSGLQEALQDNFSFDEEEDDNNDEEKVNDQKQTKSRLTIDNQTPLITEEFYTPEIIEIN